jgi:ComEC/Rec2-related protein
LTAFLCFFLGLLLWRFCVAILLFLAGIPCSRRTSGEAPCIPDGSPSSKGGREREVFMASETHRRPLLVVFLCFIVGLLLSRLFAASAAQPLGALGVALALLAWRRANRRLGLVCILGAVVLLGLVRGALQNPEASAPAAHRGRVISLRGRQVCRLAPIGQRRWRTRIELRRGLQVAVLLTGARVSGAEPGALLSLTGRLETRRFSGLQLRVRSDAARVVAVAPASFQRALARAVGSGRRALKGLSPGARGLLRSVLLGEREALSFRWRRALRDCGLGHLLAVSGLHVALVVGLALLGLRCLGLPEPWALALAGLVMLLYLAVVGARPSSVRAGVLAGGALIGMLLRRRSQPWNLLALAGLLILWWRPKALFEPGFQLSFAVVSALLWGGSPRVRVATEREVSALPRLQPWLAGRLQDLGARVAAGAARWTLASVRVSGIAFLASAPFCLVHFGRLAPLSLASNLLALPLFTLVLAFGMPGIFLASLSPSLAAPLLSASGVFADLLLCWAAVFEGWSFAIIELSPGSWLREPLLWAVAALWLAIPRSRRRWPVLAFALSALLVIDVTAKGTRDVARPRSRPAPLVTRLAAGLASLESESVAGSTLASADEMRPIYMRIDRTRVSVYGVGLLGRRRRLPLRLPSKSGPAEGLEGVRATWLSEGCWSLEARGRRVVLIAGPVSDLLRRARRGKPEGLRAEVLVITRASSVEDFGRLRALVRPRLVALQADACLGNERASFRCDGPLDLQLGERTRFGF